MTLADWGWRESAGGSVLSKGIEFEIRATDDNRHIGDLFVTKTGLIWCQGRTWRQNGSVISWAQLQQLVEGLEQEE